MSKILFPFYLISGCIAVIALYAGFTGKSVPYITNTRSAVIALFCAGFLMCAFGMIGTFINKAPAHPLSILAYTLGALALFAGIVQIFNLKVPFLSEPKNALLVITAVIIIKVVIARLRFLLPQ